MIEIQKSKIIRSIRDYFEKSGAIEVITNILRDFPNLDPNIYPLEVTYNNNFEEKIGYLHTSPEYEMKILLAKIKKDIYQITKVFRNFEGSKKHKVEFTMLEWYRTGYKMEDLIEDTHELIKKTAKDLYGKTKLIFQDKQFDLKDKDVITVDEAFYRYTGIYPDKHDDLIKYLLNKGDIKKEVEYEEAYFRVYGFYVEPNLGKERLTFLYDYPVKFSALSKIKNNKGRRFEGYINGLELVNGYEEESNYSRLKKILEKDQTEKEKNTGRKYPIDFKFLEACKDLPECSGASLGIDRLFMVLLNKSNINDV
ncbi:elongation factor P--(R)-beta-lysine ligase [Persephonella sp.]